MSFDPITYDAVTDLSRHMTAWRSVHYVLTSQIWTARKDCVVNVRALGAGGGVTAVAGKGLYPPGNGGTFAFKRVRLKAGDRVTITVGGGAPELRYQLGSSEAGGQAGGATSVRCATASLDLHIPGGQPGAASLAGQTGLRQNPPNAAPTGADWYMACTPAGLMGDNSYLAGIAPVVYGLAEEGGAAPQTIQSLWATQLPPGSLPLLIGGVRLEETEPADARLASLGRVSRIRPERHVVGCGAGALYSHSVSNGYGLGSYAVLTGSGQGMVTLEIFEEE